MSKPGFGFSRIRPPSGYNAAQVPSSVSRIPAGAASKYAILAAGALTEQEILHKELEGMHEAVESAKDLSNRLTTATLDRTSFWIQQFDDVFMAFFESHVAQANRLAAGILSLEVKVSGIAGRGLLSADEQLKEENRRLKEEMAEFEDEKVQLTEMTEKVVQQITSISEDRELLSRQIDAKNDRIAELEQQLKVLNMGLSSGLEDKNRSLVLENESLKGRIDELNSQIERLHEVNLQLEASAADQTQRKEFEAAIAKLTAENSALKIDLEKAASEKFGAQLAMEDMKENSRVDSLELEISQLKQSAEESTEIIASLRRETEGYEQVRREVETLRSDAEARSRDVSEKKAMIESLRSQISEQGKLKDEIRILTLQLEERPTYDDLQNLHAKISEASAQREQEQNAISATTAEVEHLRRQNSELAQKSHSYELQLEEQSEAAAQIGNLRRQNAELAEKNHSYELQLEEQSEIANRMSLVTTQVEQLQRQNAELLQKAQAYELQLEEQSAVGSELETLRDEVSRLRERVNTSVEEERDELVRQLTELQDANRSLHDQVLSLELMRQRLHQAEEELKQGKIMLTTYQRISDNVQAQLDETRRQNHLLVMQLQTHPSPVKRSMASSPLKLPDPPAEAPAVTRQEQPAPYDCRLSLLNKALATAESTAKQRALELQQLHGEFAPLQRQLTELQTIRQANTETIVSQEDRIRELTGKYEQEVVRYFAATGDLQTAHHELARLKRIYEELLAKHRSLTNDLMSVLHCQSEVDIISAALALSEGRDGGAVIGSVAGTAQRLRVFATNHMRKMDEFLVALNGSITMVGGSISRIERSAKLHKGAPAGKRKPWNQKNQRTRDEQQSPNELLKLSRVVRPPRTRPTTFDFGHPLSNRPVLA
jgi:chromosome segregation ATPase